MSDHLARTGEKLSLTGCLACAVDENRALQAYLKTHKRLVIFDELDMQLMSERKNAEKITLMGHVIDCAAAARFTTRLVALIESGHGLVRIITERNNP